MPLRRSYRPNIPQDTTSLGDNPALNLLLRRLQRDENQPNALSNVLDALTGVGERFIKAKTAQRQAQEYGAEKKGMADLYSMQYLMPYERTLETLEGRQAELESKQGAKEKELEGKYAFQDLQRQKAQQDREALVRLRASLKPAGSAKTSGGWQKTRKPLLSEARTTANSLATYYEGMQKQTGGKVDYKAIQDSVSQRIKDQFPELTDIEHANIITGAASPAWEPGTPEEEKLKAEGAQTKRWNDVNRVLDDAVNDARGTEDMATIEQAFRTRLAGVGVEDPNEQNAWMAKYLTGNEKAKRKLGLSE